MHLGQTIAKYVNISVVEAQSLITTPQKNFPHLSSLSLYYCKITSPLTQISIAIMVKDVLSRRTSNMSIRDSAQLPTVVENARGPEVSRLEGESLKLRRQMTQLETQRISSDSISERAKLQQHVNQIQQQIIYTDSLLAQWRSSTTAPSVSITRVGNLSGTSAPAVTVTKISNSNHSANDETRRAQAAAAQIQSYKLLLATPGVPESTRKYFENAIRKAEGEEPQQKKEATKKEANMSAYEKEISKNKVAAFAASYTKSFCSFMTDNPTVFHTVDAIAKRLTDSGFTKVRSSLFTLPF